MSRKLRIPIGDSEVPFVGNILRRSGPNLAQHEVLCGFLGAPWTLASYMIEGAETKKFCEIKKMALQRAGAHFMHLLDKLAERPSSRT
jgi:uroporphyrinogen decarboxylase